MSPSIKVILPEWLRAWIRYYLLPALGLEPRQLLFGTLRGTPCAFLSGTFYSIDRLPGMWNTLARLDPFFYMIDGFRYAFIGHADGSLTAGIWVMIVGNIVLWAAVHMMIASGYRVKP